jgi:hypothetical protein
VWAVDGRAGEGDRHVAGDVDPGGGRLHEGHEHVVRSLDRADAVDAGVTQLPDEVADVRRSGGEDDVDLHQRSLSDPHRPTSVDRR